MMAKQQKALLTPTELKKIRDALGWTQKQMADAVNPHLQSELGKMIGDAMIGHLENGNRTLTPPYQRAFVALAEQHSADPSIGAILAKVAQRRGDAR